MFLSPIRSMMDAAKETASCIAVDAFAVQKIKKN